MTFSKAFDELYNVCLSFDVSRGTALLIYAEAYMYCRLSDRNERWKSQDREYMVALLIATERTAVDVAEEIVDLAIKLLSQVTHK